MADMLTFVGRAVWLPQATGFASMDALIDATVPKSIRRGDAMDMGIYSEGMTESEFLGFFK